jgi:dihydroneopterin aldolase
MQKDSWVRKASIDVTFTPHQSAIRFFTIQPIIHMHTIHLSNLVFFAHHGVQEEEGITGTQFEVSVDISFIQDDPIRSLNQTINYVEVYEVIRQQMKQRIALLENLAENMAGAIYLLDKRITNINISINKLAAPIDNFSGKVGVSFKKMFP